MLGVVYERHYSEFVNITRRCYKRFTLKAVSASAVRFVMFCYLAVFKCFVEATYVFRPAIP